MCDTMNAVGEQPAETENDLNTNVANPSGDCENTGATLLDMPIEIILNICSFLDPMFLNHALKYVCQRFEDILSDESLWKNWVHARVKGRFPPIKQLKIFEENPIDWENVCVEMDVEYHKWTKVKENMKHVVVKDMHYASVDTLLLVNNGELCISGSRDRSIAILNVADIVTGTDETDPIYYNGAPLKMQNDAHTGWIWSLVPDYDHSTTTFYSGSWDNSVKMWDLETFECLESFGCGMSVISLVGNGKEVMAGLYAKKVLIFDQRSGNNPIQSYKAHKGAVLGLTKSNNLIASISDDKTMTVYDRVAGKVLKNDIQPINGNNAFPCCISWARSSLYVGDSGGYMNLYNPEDYAPLGSIQLWQQPTITNPKIKIKGCVQGDGVMIVCSDRGEIKFFYNSYPPTEYTSFSSSTTDITELRYQNDILGISTCDSALEFWIPNDRYVKTCA